MNNLQQVQDHGNLVRDGHTKAILNKSEEEFAQFKKQRSYRKQLESSLEDLTNRVKTLEKLVQELLDGQANKQS